MKSIFRRVLGPTGVMVAMALVGVVPGQSTDLSAQAATTIQPSSPFCNRRTVPPSIGLQFLSTAPLADRLSEVTFRSQALNGATVSASVLLPPNYDPTGATRYPVLYLFHGRSGNHLDWYKKGAIANVAQPVITVMPDAGTVGWHADWMGEERFGPDKAKPAPAWESFHIRELIPWVDANYPTRTDRAGRAIAGLSMGGYGSLLYAARHPEMFGMAGSLSGQIDMLAAYPFASLAQAYAGNLFEKAPPDPCVWGDPLLERVVWEDHSPFQLYPNLRGSKVFIAAGNGIPAQLGTNPVQLLTEIIGEVAFRRMAQGFVKRMTSAGISYRTHYTTGGHGWTLWPSQLAALYPYMLEIANDPAGSPAATNFDYRSAEPSFKAWDWTFQANRAVREFTYLEQVSANGLVAIGSGNLVVETAPLYFAGKSYRVDFNAAAPQMVNADSSGRINFTINLGEANRVQQMEFGHSAKAAFRKVVVTITPAN